MIVNLPSGSGLKAVPLAMTTQHVAEECCVAAPDQAALELADAAALAARFKALADPNRLRILSIISTDPAAETCVCDITEPLGLGQPTVSHHLKVLVGAGLLTREKRGVWAYYSLVQGALETLAATLIPKDMP